MPKQTAIMAKKSLQYTPLGPFMTLSGTIFIDRGNSARAFRSIDAAGEKMKRTKTSLWMFPEGTRHLSKEATMLPLKKGGFHLAINAGIPVTPIVCENYWHIYRKGIFESGTIKVRGKQRKEHCTCGLTFVFLPVLPPVPTKRLTAADVGILSTSVREQMLVALREISSHAAIPSGQDVDLKEQLQDSPSLEPTLESAAPMVSPSGEVVPDSVEAALRTQGSSSSIASSAVSSVGRTKLSSSENGTETEEDEGMILVGRPN
jgi:lysophosphatidate acyltransferase